MADAGGVAAAVVAGLHQLGVDTLVVDDAPDADHLVALLASWREAGPVTGVYWLPALDDEGPHSALDPLTLVERGHPGTREAARSSHARAVRRHRTPRHVPRQCHPPRWAPRLRPSRRKCSDGWGCHRLHQGLRTRACRRAGQDRRLRFGDDATAIAQCLLAETLRDPGAVEVGRLDGQRWSIALASEAAEDGGPERSLTPESVFVITGAAGSIVSAITADLATCGGTFHLLDLVPEPDPADHDLELFVTDRDGLKRELAERIAASGERATPARVELELARLERAKAARRRDRRSPPRRRQRPLASGRPRPTAKAVGAGSCEVQASHARVDVLLHAAGAGDQPHARRQDATRVRPRLRRQERRVVQPPARVGRSRDRGRGGLQLDRRTLRQRWADRLQRRQRPDVQERVELPHHPT